MKEITIGIDLGGTNLRIGAVTENLNILASEIIPTCTFTQTDAPLETLSNLIHSFIQKNRICNVSSISIGVPSSVEKDRQTVVYAANLIDINGNYILKNTNLASHLEKHLSIPVLVSHDTDNILLYDVHHLHLEQKQIVVGIYIGTGVGASVLINGQIFNGTNGVALDIGHMPFFNSDKKCTCGNTGCCECYTSGWALQEIRKKYYPDEPIQDLFLRHQNDIPLQDFLAACAHTFSVMSTIFNPDAIIAGGGVIEMNNFPKKQFEQLITKHTSSDVTKYGLNILYSQPSSVKGIIGAALAVKNMNV